MSFLFDDARSGTPPPGRSTSGLWLSVVVHVVAIGLIVVTIGAPEAPPAPRAKSTRVFLPAMLPSAPVETPRLPPPAPPPPPPVRELARAEAPKPPPVAPVVAKTIEPLPAPLLPAPAPVERPIEKPEVQRPVETGLFERTNGARTSQAAAAVTTGGFGNAAVSPRAAATGEIQTAGFDQRASAPARAVVAETKPLDRPVEIVFKPTPEYTDEARSARVEGTVSLELEFTAAGDVRVLRVVRGLGHGLDEAAQRAAVRIRFKPAQSDAGPVDSRATVHITFRLS